MSDSIVISTISDKNGNNIRKITIGGYKEMLAQRDRRSLSNNKPMNYG